MKYIEEIEWLISNEKRNKFIINLALSLKGNTIIFYQYVDKHGKILLKHLEDQKKKKVYFFAGSVSPEERDEIRSFIEKENNIILLASYGTTSTGVNIKNISNIIFASPSKARVKILQSIGRGLRLRKGKINLTVFDIADDLVWKKKKNHTYRHYISRIKLYNEEEFEYKNYYVNLYE